MWSLQHLINLEQHYYTYIGHKACICTIKLFLHMYDVEHANKLVQDKINREQQIVPFPYWLIYALKFAYDVFFYYDQAAL